MSSLPASLATSLPAATSFPPASARAGRFWPSLLCVMPGQPPVIAGVTAVGAAAADVVRLVSPAAAVAASVVTCWRTPACQSWASVGGGTCPSLDLNVCKI